MRRRLPHGIVEPAVEVGRLGRAADGDAPAGDRRRCEPAAAAAPGGRPRGRARGLARAIHAAVPALVAQSTAVAGNGILERVFQLEHSRNRRASGGWVSGADATGAERPRVHAIPSGAREPGPTGSGIHPLDGGFRQPPASIPDCIRRTTWDERVGERRDDAVLRVEQIRESPVDPGAAAHCAGLHVDEPRGDAQQVADTLIAPGHHPLRTQPATGTEQLPVDRRPTPAHVPRRPLVADHPHAQVPQVARHRLGNPVADPGIGGLAAQIGERDDQNCIRRLPGGRRRQPEPSDRESRDASAEPRARTRTAWNEQLHQDHIRRETGKSRSLRRRKQRSPSPCHPIPAASIDTNRHP